MQARSSLVNRHAVLRVAPFQGPAASQAPKPSARRLVNPTTSRSSLPARRCAEDAVVAPSEGGPSQALEPHQALDIYYLDNGLRVVFLPNPSPVDRFEAHLEVHTGSVDESAEEQGIAHLVEHVTFLGSKKRETLLGTGARSNAYTDFHHTVFHVHAPRVNAGTGAPMLAQVLDALAEIAFEPEFLPSRIEKERKAVTAEAQMMNTIEYRVDCQLLQYLHAENALGYRFPIGKMEQVAGWDRAAIMDFWARGYHPANATLYLVGDLEPAAARAAVRQAFDRVPAGRRSVRRDAQGVAAVELPEEAHASASATGAGTGGAATHLSLLPTSLRPPVQHAWGCGAAAPAKPPPQISVFRHRLLQLFQLSLFCKLPIQPLTTMQDLSVLQFRVNARYVEADPPFVSIELDHSDSGREGCAVSTLTITSEPGDWRGAVGVAVAELRRLQRHGVSPSELARYRTALLRDSEQLAEAAHSTPSAEHLDFVMESLALGHTVLGPREAHEALVATAEGISAEEVGALARSLLSFASHFGNEAQLMEEYAADPEAWAAPGPSVATAAVACLPAFTDASGHSSGGGVPLARGASLATTQHEPPEGAVRFRLSGEEIAAALAEAGGADVAPLPEVDVPEHLVPEDVLAALLEERRPAWVEVPGAGSARPAPHPASGVVQRRLSNGVALNYRSGTVGGWAREQVELFCISKLINCVLEADEEHVAMDFHLAVSGGGIAATFQLLHLFLEAPAWEGAAAERAKQMYASHARALPKSLERATADRIMTAMMGVDRQFRDPTQEEIAALSLEGMRAAVSAQLRAGNLEVCVVGDFDPAELEDAALKYLGTVAPGDARDATPAPDRAFALLAPPMRRRHSVWHLRDSDERACAFIAGAAPPRWAIAQEGAASAGTVAPPAPPPARGSSPAVWAEHNAVRRRHPLYPSVTLALLTEVVNSRLFTTVRDTLGLTYDVSFELAGFDRLPAGWFHVAVTSTPGKIGEAAMASLRVLRTLRTQPISGRELQRAQRTLAARHETDLKDNGYWLGLMANLQAPGVPLKTLDCLRDLRAMYDTATVDDLYDMHQKASFGCMGWSGGMERSERFNFDDDAIFSCIGVSGREAGAVKDHPLLAALPAQREDGAGEAVVDVKDADAFFSAVKVGMLFPGNPLGRAGSQDGTGPLEM
ncbi:putative zinc protease PqqL [Auxenochlorella protothecoides]|uniref:Putative zinc protease PqqL n=1 Tax=Auxenochlorella protothecoides TaxID=3075 RepID=A0A087SN65_AUXPR|nr:putative zinc protease PqqL [Auxenochlorella protothecoides]KFM27169.1 putative zinc protease PqqL [Auxenochlorella protothecoides]